LSFKEEEERQGRRRLQPAEEGDDVLGCGLGYRLLERRENLPRC